MKMTESQLNEWRIASNRVSLESLRYAADICGCTTLTNATITTLEKLIAGRASDADCRVLYQSATKSTFRDEPLLDAILIALKWGTSDTTGEFMVGNIVDPIYAARLDCGKANPDAATYKRLEEIHDSFLLPYYQRWTERPEAASRRIVPDSSPEKF